MNAYASRVPLTALCGALLSGPALLLAAALTALIGTGRALAQDCGGGNDCRPGFTCVTEHSQICSAPAPTDECKAGVMCAPPLGGAGGSGGDVECQPYDYSYCANAPCSADSDCPSDMVCHAQEYTECSVSAAGAGGSAGAASGEAGSCAPDEMCSGGGVVDCVTRTGDPVCTLRYTLPCHADADCGAGFSCKESFVYSCMGGGPVPTAGAGAAGAAGATGPAGAAGVADDKPEIDRGTCTQEPSGSFYCELQDLPCEADSDCPGTLKCHEQWGWRCSGGTAGAGEPGVLIDGGVAAGGAGGATSTPGAMTPAEPDQDPMEGTAGSASAGSGSSICESYVIAKSCMPDDYYSPGGPGMGTGGAGGSTGGGDTGTADAGMTPPPSGGPSAGASAPGSGNAGNGGTGDESESDGDSNAGWFGHHHRGLGCAIADDDASDAMLGTFGLIGLVALALRRRARSMV